MSWENTSIRYGSLSLEIYWLELFSIIAVYGSIGQHVMFEKGKYPREAIKVWHFMLGMLFLRRSGCVSLPTRLALNRTFNPNRQGGTVICQEFAFGVIRVDDRYVGDRLVGT